jgi:hypothetical protein
MTNDTGDVVAVTAAFSLLPLPECEVYMLLGTVDDSALVL